jgi:hypothetical protein
VPRGAALLALGLAACASEAPPASSSLCDDATAHVAVCFGGAEVSADACDPARAASVLDQTCAELRESDAKTDCGFFTWWDCYPGGGGSGSSTPRGAAIRVSVEECLSDVIGSCAGVRAASCARVVLETAEGELVREARSNAHGGALFEDLEAHRDYVVRVFRRDGAPAAMDTGTAVLEVSVADELERVYLYLNAGEGDAVQACAAARVRMTVFADGLEEDSDETEWDWIATVDGEGAHRSYRRADESASSFRVFGMYAGDHEVAFHRVAIPDSRRLPNRNEELLDRYALGFEPATFSFGVGDADLGGEVVTEVFEIDDPAPGQ